MLYLVLKYLHVIGAAVLLGTGAGIAFFMLAAHLTRNAATIADVARIVVIADFLFTATAVVAQPVTGALLVRSIGYSFREGWIALSFLLYLITGALWLPVGLGSARRHQPRSGRAIISQKMARTAAKAGNPNANQVRNSA